jgi:hypothetical protein
MRPRRWLVVAMSAGVWSGCGGGSTPPTQPDATSFLAGTWSGTLTIDDVGARPTSGATTWVFEVVPGTNRQTFTVSIQSQQSWLPIAATVTSAITPSNVPPARISTQGTYNSPRGCTGTLLSTGTATQNQIDADLSGVDCPTVFHGHLNLSKNR